MSFKFQIFDFLLLYIDDSEEEIEVPKARVQNKKGGKKSKAVEEIIPGIKKPLSLNFLDFSFIFFYFPVSSYIDDSEDEVEVQKERVQNKKGGKKSKAVEEIIPGINSKYLSKFIESFLSCNLLIDIRYLWWKYDNGLWRTSNLWGTPT